MPARTRIHRISLYSLFVRILLPFTTISITFFTTGDDGWQGPRSPFLDHICSNDTRLMLSEIGSRHVPQSCAYKDVRGVVLFRRVTRETDSCCKRIRSQLDPFILGVSVSDHRRKCETCGGMPGWKRPSATPKLSRAIRRVRKLAVERELESQICATRRPHCRECFESCIAQIGMVCHTPSHRPEQLIQAPARGQRSTTARPFAARISIECDCQQAGLPSRSVHRWLPRLATPISNCWDEQRFGEQLSIRARIARLQSRSRGKTRGYCNPDLWRHLVPVVVVDFPAPAVRI